MLDRPELRLHIRRLVVDRNALGEGGVFDEQALREQIAQQLGLQAAMPVLAGRVPSPLMSDQVPSANAPTTQRPLNW